MTAEFLYVDGNRSVHCASGAASRTCSLESAGSIDTRRRASIQHHSDNCRGTGNDWWTNVEQLTYLSTRLAEWSDIVIVYVLCFSRHWRIGPIVLRRWWNPNNYTSIIYLLFMYVLFDADNTPLVSSILTRTRVHVSCSAPLLVLSGKEFMDKANP